VRRIAIYTKTFSEHFDIIDEAGAGDYLLLEDPEGCTVGPKKGSYRTYRSFSWCRPSPSNPGHFLTAFHYLLDNDEWVAERKFTQEYDRRAIERLFVVCLDTDAPWIEPPRAPGLANREPPVEIGEMLEPRVA
jgi:hypothetical protein